MNAVNSIMADELIWIWQNFKQDDSLLVAILTGAGEKAFYAVADIELLAPERKIDVTVQYDNAKVPLL